MASLFAPIFPRYQPENLLLMLLAAFSPLSSLYFLGLLSHLRENLTQLVPLWISLRQVFCVLSQRNKFPNVKKKEKKLSKEHFCAESIFITTDV